ncbi:hypothetical protein RP20_CCG009698 [Aedes albopictus]|nr:hypothetical protein RP20_CCG009698 [Aedes albopictus]
MVGWRYRGTFTSLWHPDKPELDRLDVRERDDLTKLKSKRDADECRGAKESTIKVGDWVLLAQQRRNKTDATFSGERFRVLAKDGAKLVVLSANGIQYSRSVNDVRKVPMSLSEMPDNPDSGGVLVCPGDDPSGTTERSAPENRQSVETTSRSLRRRDDIQRPARFDKNFVYAIFH